MPTFYSSKPLVKAKRSPGKQLSSRERGYDARWEKVRKAHLAEFPFCAECGKWATQVHHIDGNNQNNDPTNHMSLCHSCHSRITRLSQMECLRAATTTPLP